MSDEQGQSTHAILDLTRRIEDARREVETNDTLAARTRLKEAQIAYRTYLLGLNGLAEA